MLAMLIPASPSIVPTLPMTPGRSSYRKNDHVRGRGDVDVEVEHPHDPLAGPAEQRAGHRDTPASLVSARSTSRFT